MGIRGILFDKDGTLIEVNGTWVPLYRDMFKREFGLDREQSDNLLAKAGFDIATETFIAGSILAGGTTQDLVERLWPELTTEERHLRIKLINNTVAPEAKKFIKPLMPLAPLFDELRAMGFRLGLGTNDSEASGRAHMEHLGVADHFDIVIGADSVDQPKPSGQMIARFAAEMGLQAHEIAMVGDNSHDMEEAHRGGAGLAIAVLSGNAAVRDIEHLAHHVLPDVSVLPKFFRESGYVL